MQTSTTRRPRPARPGRTRRRLGAAAFALAAALTGGAAAAPAVAAPQRGLDRVTLQRSIDAMTRAGYIGVVAEVVSPQGRWSGAAGTRTLASQPRAQWVDRTRVASITKTMVSVVALQLVQEGRWTLETRVGDVLPGLLPGHDAVTVRQLLAHTSGAPDYLVLLLAEVDSLTALQRVVSQPRTDRQLVGLANQLPWLFEPGTQWSYSNTNYVVVGMMIERLTGRPMADLLRARVFKPAKMNATELPSTPRIKGAHLTEYAVMGPQRVSLAGFQPSIFSAAGGVVSNASDLNRFQQALQGGRLLRPDLLAAMRTPTDLPGDTQGYGLGVYPMPDLCQAPGSSAMWGHDGASFGTFSFSLGSTDGTRSIALSWTGRHYPQGDYATSNAAILTMLSQTCSTPGVIDPGWGDLLGGSSAPQERTAPDARTSRPAESAVPRLDAEHLARLLPSGN